MDTIIIFIYKEIIYRFGLLKILQNNKRIHFINKVIQMLIKRLYSLSLLYHL